MRLYHSSCDPRGDTHAPIQLLCRISGFTPGDLEVTWLVDERRDKNLLPVTDPAQQEGELASAVSWLNVSQGEWLSHRTYTCQARLHGCTVEASARTCPGTAPLSPRCPHPGPHPPVRARGARPGLTQPLRAQQSPSPAA